MYFTTLTVILLLQFSMKPASFDSDMVLRNGSDDGMRSSHPLLFPKSVTEGIFQIIINYKEYNTASPSLSIP